MYHLVADGGISMLNSARIELPRLPWGRHCASRSPARRPSGPKPTVGTSDCFGATADEKPDRLPSDHIADIGVSRLSANFLARAPSMACGFRKVGPELPTEDG